MQRVLEILGDLARPGASRELVDFIPLRDAIRAIPREQREWLVRPEFRSLLLGNFTAVAGRRPGTSASPLDQGKRRLPLAPSNPSALGCRMDQFCSTPAGRALIGQAPFLAGRDFLDANFDAGHADVGLTYRHHTAFFATLLSSTEGMQAARLAAALAQAWYSRIFWNKNVCGYVPRIVVGNGPVGVAFVHALTEAGDQNRTLLVSANEPGGVFSWGSFLVNHRSRPVNIDYRGGPATEGPLDDFLATLCSPSDVGTTWSYTQSDVIAAAIAPNAMAAAPTITATVKTASVLPNGRIQVLLEDPTTGARKYITTGELILALGPGRPRRLPGGAADLTMPTFLAQQNPSQLGKVVGVVGGRDSAAVAIARLFGINQSGGLPRQTHTLERVMWIRPQGPLYKETAATCERLRYSGELGPFLPRRLDPDYPAPIEVIQGRVVGSTSRSGGDQLLRCDSSGVEGSRTVRVDNVISATGFVSTLPDILGMECSDLSIFYGSSTIPLARRVPGANIFVVGAGANLPINATERRLYPILGTLGIPENSAALFRALPQVAALAGILAYKNRGRILSARFVQKEASRSRAKAGERRQFAWSIRDDGSNRVESMQMLLTRLRIVVATHAESLACGDAILLRLRAEPKVLEVISDPLPTSLVEQLLIPLFSDDAVCRGLWRATQNARHVHGEACNILKRDIPSVTTWQLTIPSAGGVVWAEGLSFVPCPSSS
jgi:hypothetical protein